MSISQQNTKPLSTRIDSIVQLLRLESWSEWTSCALASSPSWPAGLIEDVRLCAKEIMTAPWPEESDELKRSAFTLVYSVQKAAEMFSEPAEKSREKHLDSNADHERYRVWLKDCQQWIYNATKAANWFSDVVSRDINPLFFAEKGKFVIKDGPFLDGSFRTLALLFTEDEKMGLPKSLFMEAYDSGK